MPFTSVAENIGKFLPNRFAKQKKERTAELIELVDLVDFADVKVKNLSGGQKQRVALARVLAKNLNCYCWTNLLATSIIFVKTN